MASISRYTLSKPERAAAIIVAIGKERAAKVLESFRSDELKAVMNAAQNLRTVEQYQLEELVADFEKDFQSGTGLLDSDREFEAILSEFLGERAADGPDGASEPAKAPDRKKTVWETLEDFDLEPLAVFFGKQTATLAATILSKLSAKRVALVLNKLDPEKAQKILIAMVDGIALPPAVMGRIEAHIQNELGLGDREAFAKIDTRIAEILNDVDKDQSEKLVEALRSNVDEIRVRNIQNSIFRFDDIALLESGDRSIVLDSIPSEIIAMALVGATPELSEAILSATSPRTRRMIEGEISGIRNANPDRVSAARSSVCSVVLKSAAEGAIQLPER